MSLYQQLKDESPDSFRVDTRIKKTEIILSCVNCRFAYSREIKDCKGCKREHIKRKMIDANLI